jgi:hypothetical protein
VRAFFAVRKQCSPQVTPVEGDWTVAGVRRYWNDKDTSIGARYTSINQFQEFTPTLQISALQPHIRKYHVAYSCKTPNEIWK